MSAAPKPDPHALAHATFRGPGQKRLKEAINALLAGGPVSEARLLTVLNEQRAIDHREAGRAWMKDHQWSQSEYVKKHPGEEPVDSQAAFDRGAGRPDYETQAHRYAQGERLLVVDRTLAAGTDYWPVTASGQDYGDRRGNRNGLVYWRLSTPEEKAIKREKHRWPKAPKEAKAPKPKTPRPPKPTPVPLPATPPAPDEEIDAITARIRELDGAPLEQGRLLRRVYDQQMYLGLDVPDFDAYAQEFFSFSLRHAYRLMDLARVEEIVSFGPIGQKDTTLLPQNEFQARALVPLIDRPDDLRQAWGVAVSTAPARQDGSPKITAAHIKDVLERLGFAPDPPARPPAPPDLDAVLAALEAGAYDARLPRFREAVAAREQALASQDGVSWPHAPAARPGAVEAQEGPETAP